VWKEHLYALDHLRQGIGLRAYGQLDPLNEYKSEAFALFNAMLDELKERVTALLARVELAPDQPAPPMQVSAAGPSPFLELHPEPEPMLAGAAGPDMALEMAHAPAPIAVAAQPMRTATIDPEDPETWRNTPRNAPCPCGSGKKFKHCHGRLA
jgi:preprotein translocase subunit SecA